jgi:hypothetical protein
MAIQHVYALFERAEDAKSAIEEVRAAGCESEYCSAVLHQDHLDKSRLTISERAGRELGGRGALVAGAVGATVAGLAALGGGLVGVGPLAAAAMAGGVMAAYGLLAGSISGSDEPEKALRLIQEEVEKGKFLIALEAEDPKLQAMCEEVFKKYGGYQIVS